jgi:hypothetical protein
MMQETNKEDKKRPLEQSMSSLPRIASEKKLDPVAKEPQTVVKSIRRKIIDTHIDKLNELEAQNLKLKDLLN